MERAERIVVLCVGLFIEPWLDGALIWILWGMLVLISITAVQRFVKVWKQAAVAPVTQARIDLRRERRESRRGARTRRVAAPGCRSANGFRAGRTDRWRRRHESTAQPVRPHRCSDLRRLPHGGAGGARASRLRRPGAGAGDRDRRQLRQPRTPGDDRPPPAPGRSDDRRSAAAAGRPGGVRLVHPLLARELPAPVPVDPSGRAGMRVDGYEHVVDGARTGQRRDPRAAAPRRLGMGGPLDRRPGPRTHRRSSRRSSRPSCSSGSSISAASSGCGSCRSARAPAAR